MIQWLFQGQNLILRTTGAAVLSFLIVLFLGPKVIRILIRRKLGDRPEFDHADLNQLTKHKSNTPTMGGVLIVVAIAVSVLLFGNIRDNMYVKTALVVLLPWLGGLGFVDDWFKLRRANGQTSRDGLVMWQKMIFQIGLAVLVAIFIWNYGEKSIDPNSLPTGLPVVEAGRADSPAAVAGAGYVTIEGKRIPAGTPLVNPAHSFYLPFVREPIHLNLLAYVIIAVLTIVGSSNAVNLTDGMDGLASGCMVIAAGFFLIIAELVGVREWTAFGGFHLPNVIGSDEMTVICAAMMGSCLGFLWYNSHPAQVFMGDTGSLPLGGLLGYTALVTRHEVLLLVAGGVFFMEAGSVILQVAYFKYTKRKSGGEGKRLFRCAPIHHHFHLGGWAESKVVARFWILGIIFAAIALATLKLR